MKSKKITYSSEHMARLVGQDINLESGKYHCDIKIEKTKGKPTEYTFTFSERKGAKQNDKGVHGS